MNCFTLLLIFYFIYPINKYEAKEDFKINFKNNYEILKIYLPDANINIFEAENYVVFEGEIKVYHRDKEKANFYLKKIKIDFVEDKNVLKVLDKYSKDRAGREAKKLRKLFTLNIYAPKNLPLGIYLKNGEVNFKEKQERNIVIEGNHLNVFGSLSRNYKKIEAINFFGDLNISGENLIKRYLFPMGKKVIYLNPNGKKEGYFKIFKGNINIKIGV